MWATRQPRLKQSFPEAKNDCLLKTFNDPPATPLYAKGHLSIVIRPTIVTSVRSIAILTALIAAVRLGAFWVLVIKEWIGNQDRSFVLFYLLLLPEASFVPNSIIWTHWSAIGFSALLFIGSTLVAALAYFLAHVAKPRVKRQE
jgi:hypothetical protein